MSSPGLEGVSERLSRLWRQIGAGKEPFPGVEAEIKAHPVSQEESARTGGGAGYLPCQLTDVRFRERRSGAAARGSGGRPPPRPGARPLAPACLPDCGRRRRCRESACCGTHSRRGP
ncbi:hypothetical protein R6Z07F_017854 [Ovis aries]